jgi:NAD(P)-dependent dehydrogenase (short-subunit alcohol dehydrogenase family)
MSTRHAVVTGGGKGIGRAIALRLNAEGFTVTVLGRDEQSLADTAAQAISGGSIRAVVCDVSSEDAVQAVFGDSEPVDVLVNNAGIAGSAPVGRTSMAEWESMMMVNATGVFLCTRAVIDSMRKRNWGRVVTVASIASHHGAPYVSSYVASKHAALGFMRSVASEVRGSGVTANCVCPGYVRSDMTDRTIANIVARTDRSVEQCEQSLNSALGRLVEPEEVSAAVMYLISDQAAAVNGQSIVIDGGEFL